MLAQELPASEQQAMMAHVESCQHCQQVLEQLTAFPHRTGPALRKTDLQTHIADPNAPPPASDPATETRAEPRARSAEALPDTAATVLPEPYPPAAHEDWPTLPGYEIQGVVGRGGMGVVYQALHFGLNRPVALKMILTVGPVTSEQRLRLHIEGETLARLQHPNIVQVFEVGTFRGRPYLAMELISGGSLEDKLAGQPQDARHGAHLVETLARALHHAHQQGIVHRDLKPANILLAVVSPEREASLPRTPDNWPRTTVPKVTDFGLAKHQQDQLALTQSGVVAGTPSYMAPEQAEAQRERIGPATDIYALGAILYQVLTGRPPFASASAVETLLRVKTEEPVPISQLRPATPRDLETICQKCLQKEPGKRYATALGLADDLRRFLGGEPIHARPVGMLERTVKWVRRRPAVAGLLAAVLLVTAAGMGLVFWQWQRAEDRASVAAAAQGVAEEKENRERQARREVERLSARSLLEQGQELCERGEVAAGLLHFVRALEGAERTADADLERVARLNLAAWQPYCVRQRAAFRHRSWVWTLAYSRDGRLIATAGKDGCARIWDAATGKPLSGALQHAGPVWSVAFSPDGKLLLTGSGSPDGSQGEARLWDVATGKPRHDVPLRHPTPVQQVAFGPDGQSFLTVSPPQAQLWQTASQAPIGPPLHPGVLLSAALSPDGQTVLTGGADGTARLWAAASGQPIGSPFRPHGSRVEVVAFSPDGRTLATAACQLMAVDAQQRFLTGLQSEVQLWHVADGVRPGPVLRPCAWVKALAFRPDGQALATGSAVFAWTEGAKALQIVSGEARLWSTRTGQPLTDPLLHPHAVWAVAFAPNGRLLLTGCEDTQARLFRLTERSRLWLTAESVATPFLHEGLVRAVAFSPDGRTALTGSAGGDEATGVAARLWEVPPEAVFGQVLFQSSEPTTMAFSPGGTELVTADKNGGLVRHWDIGTGRELAPALPHDAVVTALAFSPDGKLLATCSDDGSARLWDWPSGRLQRTYRHGAKVVGARISPDGRTLLSHTGEGAVHFWDIPMGKPLRPPWQHKGSVLTLAFTSEGDALWLENEGETIQLWRKRTAGPVEEVWRVPGKGRSAALDVDDQTLLTLSWSNHLERRDLRTGEVRGPAIRLEQGLVLWRASPDGGLSLTSGWNGTQLLDTATGLRVGPAHKVRRVGVAAFRADGRAVAFVLPEPHLAGEVPIQWWRVPTPAQGRTQEMRSEVERLPGSD
jgi:WD40 repeat protein